MLPPRFRPRCVAALAAAAVFAACGERDTTAPPEPVGSLDAEFEGGALEGWTWTDEGSFDLTLAKAPTGLSHYYSFKILGRADEPTEFRFLDAQLATWEAAWFVEQPVVSEDGGRTWHRIPEAFYTGFFYRFRYTPRTDEAWIATLPPYQFSRWLERAAELEAADQTGLRLDVLGSSRDGRPLHRLTIGEPDDDTRPSIWIVARQHADEMPGSWMAEGFLDWLLADGPAARSLRERLTVHLVPFMNPDGAVRGYQRLNTAGLDLNRVWDAPDPATAPTVAATRQAMRADDEDGSPVVLFLDLHGDPGNRKNYGIGHARDAAERARTRLVMAMMEVNTDLFSGPLSELVAVQSFLGIGWATQELGAVSYAFEGSHLDVYHGPHAGRFMGIADWKALGVALGETLAQMDLAALAAAP